MARPPTWHTKITAPEAALEVYAAIAKAAQSEAFKECHVFSGALNKLGVPVIGADGTSKATSVILGGYIALPLTGRKLCATVGCINPFHYKLAGDFMSQKFVDSPELKRESVSTSEYMELIEYIRDKNNITAGATLQEYRSLIPEDDISTDTLGIVFEAMPEGWKA